MDNIQDREEWRRERSLLALGQAMRGDDVASPRGSLLAIAAEADRRQRPDARARHGLARAHREAMMEADAPLAPQQDEIEEQEQRSPASTVARDDSTPLGPVTDRAPHGVARRRSWRLVVATTLLGAGLGAVVAFSLPTRYQATAEVSIGGDGAQTPAGGVIDSQLRVLTSGMVLTRVVDTLNLAGDPEFNGRSGSEGISGLLRAILVRSDAGSDAGHRQALAVEHLAGSVSVARGGSAGSIAVTATTGNGEKSALIANAVADAFVQTYGQGRSGEATGSTGKAGANEAAVEARRRLNEFAKAYDMGDTAKNTDSVAEILELDENLAAARSRTEALNAKVAALRAAGVDTIAAGLPREFETGAVEALRAQYLDLKRQADSAAVKLGPRNPERRGIEAQLAGAGDRLSVELRRIVATQQAALKQAVVAEQELAARLARTKLTGQDIAMLRDLQHLAAAEIDTQAITASIAANGSDVSGQGAHVVSRAATPLQPSGPPRMALTLAGTLLGLFAGLGLGLRRGNAEGETEFSPERSDPQEPIEQGYRAPPPVADTAWGEGGYPAAAPPPWLAETMPSSGELPLALSRYRSGSFDSSAIPESMETAMHPFYPDRAFAQQQQHEQPQQWLQPAAYPPQAYLPQAYPPPAYPPQAYAPQAMMPQPYPQAWQPAPPMPAYPYAQPMPAYGSQHQPAQPSFPYPMQDMRPAPFIDQGAIDDIRASLHEFREALRELAENRPRRRIF